jgi:VWFA-related protein
VVKILSVFLGLVTGLHPVAVRVGGDIAAVEIQVDGRSVGVLRGEPWEMVCDFGDALAPHQLVAVGRDEAGREISRDRQWINLPRPRSEVVLMIEGNATGPPARAGAVWHSIDRRKPDQVTVTFDGEELAVTDPRSFALPPYDPDTSHLLAVELLFDTALARAQILVGGMMGAEFSGDLTALPVILAPRARLPKANEMKGWFLEGGRPLEVVALERGGADIIMVLDPSNRLRDRLESVGQEMAYLRTRRTPSGTRDGMMVPLGIRPRDRVNMVVPVAELAAESTQPVLLFPRTPDLTASPGGIATIVTRPVARDWPLEAAQIRIADAVAVAGLAAAENQRARVVVLISDPETVDVSRFDELTVRDYLRRINVPLFVWTPGKKGDEGPWGDCATISSARRLVDRIEDLSTFLERQVVVWLAGRHLSDRITLSPEAGGTIHIAGEATAMAVSRETDRMPPVIADADEHSPAAGPEAREAVVEPVTTAPVDSQSAAVFGGSVEVRTVNVHVVVSDKKGNRVTDLMRDDFEVFEDGAPVEITHFVPPPVLADAGGPVSTGETDERAAEGAAPTREEEQPFHLVILFDTAHIRPAQRELMVEALREFLADGLPPTAQLMLVAQDGPIRIRQTFTGSPHHVMQGFDELMNAGHSPADEERRALHAEITGVSQELQDAYEIGDSAMIASAEIRRNTLIHQIRSEAETQRFEMRANLDALRRFVSSLGGVMGRKVMLYVGEGLTLNPAEDLYAGAVRAEVASDQLRVEQNAFDLHREANELVRQANANGVTFYTLTPPSRYTLLGAAMPTRGPLGYMLSAEMTLNTNIREGVCLLSGETGGRCQSGGSDPGQLLDEASRDFASTYTLAYSPDRPFDDDYHHIEIRVRRPGLRLRHRESYVDKKHDESLIDRLSAALRFGADDNPLGMNLDYRASQALDGGRYLVPLHLKIPVERLALLPTSAGDARQCQATLLVATMDSASHATGTQEYAISFQVEEEKFASGRSLVYAHAVHLTLAEGKHRIAIGVWDDIGRVGSFLSKELQVGGP